MKMQNTSKSELDTLVIIVTFNSDIKRLKKILGSVKHCADILVVDNSTQIEIQNKLIKLAQTEKYEIKSLRENLGIAAAQNIGIKYAIKKNYDNIFLLDDDSIPELEIISKLKKARKTSNNQDHIVSARLVDKKGKNLSNCNYSSSDFTECRDLTSSGTLIPTKIFLDYGLFEEKLFIDCVDFEFGWRVSKHLVKQYVSNSIKIKHELGEGNIFFLRLPTPIRHYYQYRNILTLISRGYTPRKWKIVQSFKLMVKLFLISLLADQKLARAKYCLRGCKDFCKGRYGVYQK